MTPAKKKGENEAAEFLNNLTEFLGDTEGQNLKDIKKELIEEGVNVDKIITNVKRMVQLKISESKRAWLKEAPAMQAAMLDKLNNIHVEMPQESSKLREIIKDIVGRGENKELVFAFRNFNDLPDDDLRKLYLDYLKLLSLNQENDEKNS